MEFVEQIGMVKKKDLGRRFAQLGDAKELGFWRRQFLGTEDFDRIIQTVDEGNENLVEFVQKLTRV